MRPPRYWILFAACAVGWLILSLLIAPSISGVDVFVFRDAGWNLAAWGSFQSAAGPYSHDLIPRFYAHYTPILPLLFAGYATVFPRNAYAGTVFNLVLGLSAAAVGLWWVLRQPPGKLRDTVAWTVAVLAPVFMTYDRPEVVALILFSAVISLGVKPGPRPLVAGTLIALTFLAQPFVAIVAAVWTFALFLSHDWNRPRRWLLSLRQAAMSTVPAIVILAAVALLYYSIDRAALARFAANAFGVRSGLGMTLSMRSFGRLLSVLHETIFGSPIVWGVEYSLSLLSCGLLAAWSILHRKELRYSEWLPIAAGLACLVLAILLSRISIPM